eukprot:Hpha_TRINITY_DN13494_c0_g2::TRINITY_DN13494_c0_g2_i1::g.130967::m.130967
MQLGAAKGALGQGGAVNQRLKGWWAGLPLATRSCFVVCTVLLFAGGLLGLEPRNVCTGPSLIVARGQLWRLLSSAFFHAGFLHWALNMMALCSMLPSVERTHGTPGAGVLVLCYAALSNLLGLAPATILYGVTGLDSLFGIIQWRECSLGLSGVLFALLTLESTTDDTGLIQRNRLLCGFAVSAAAYPWVMLIVLQLLLPHVSFTCHLGGIIAAHLLNPLRLRGIMSTADSLCPQSVKGMDSFVPANRVPLPYAAPESAALQGGRMWLTRFLQASAAAARPAPPRPAAGAEGEEGKFPGKGRTVGDAERGDAVFRSGSTRSGEAANRSPHRGADDSVAV